MADRAPPPLSPAAQQLLRAFRDEQSPTELDRRRGLVQVRARLEAEASSSAPGRFHLKAIGVTLLLAASVLLAVKFVGAGVTALAHRARQPAVEAPYQGGVDSEGGQAVERAARAVPPRRAAPRPVEQAVVVEPEADTEAAPAPGSASGPTPGPASGSARRPAAPTSTTVESAADLQAELALIKRAHQAQQAHRHADGLAALAEHARRFPGGTLADERRVMQAELLCASGRASEARAHVRRFLAQRSGSALAGRMRGVCAEPGG